MSLDNFPILPAERIAAIEAALRQAFNTVEVTGVSLLAGGLSGSAVYKLTIDSRAYTLKLVPALEKDGVSSGHLALAAEAGVAPRLYFEDPLQGISISEFIVNKPVRSALTPAQLVTGLAGTIRKIHSISTSGQSIGLFETVDGLISRFTTSNRLSGPVFDECFHHYELLKSRYPNAATDQVLSHNDLNPNNILCDGENIWIIDWDAAGINDRYVDLANAANYFVNTEEQERSFLHTYFGQDASDYQMACFTIMRPVCRIIYSLLMFQLALQGKPDDFRPDQEMNGMDMNAFGGLMATGKISLAEAEGQFMYGKVLMNTALEQMRKPRFTASLNHL